MAGDSFALQSRDEMRASARVFEQREGLLAAGRARQNRLRGPIRRVLCEVQITSIYPEARIQDELGQLACQRTRFRELLSVLSSAKQASKTTAKRLRATFEPVHKSHRSLEQALPQNRLLSRRAQPTHCTASPAASSKHEVDAAKTTQPDRDNRTK